MNLKPIILVLKSRLDKQFKALYREKERVKKMYWIDHCKHGKEAYIGSFKVFEAGDKLRTYDLHVFDTKHGQEVCIRYGNEDYEYISPGSLGGFIKRSHMTPAYQAACDLLLDKGDIKYIKRAK